LEEIYKIIIINFINSQFCDHIKKISDHKILKVI
jgi:hypothetical protein